MDSSASAHPLSLADAAKWPGVASIHDGTVTLAKTATKNGGKLEGQLVVNFTDGSSASIMSEPGVPGFFEIVVFDAANGDQVTPWVPASRLAGLVEQMGKERAAK